MSDDSESPKTPTHTKYEWDIFKQRVTKTPIKPNKIKQQLINTPIKLKNTPRTRNYESEDEDE